MSSASRSPIRLAIPSGPRTRIRAAASSIARGRPSSARQIRATASAFAVGQLEAGHDGLGTLDEELDRLDAVELGEGRLVRLRDPEGRHLVLALRRQVQPRPARDDDAQRSPEAEQSSDERRSVEEMLEVVEHEQPLEVDDRVRERLLDGAPRFLGDRERLRDRRGNEPGIRDRPEVDDHGFVPREPACDRERETGLARAAGARQRHEPRVVPVEQGADRGHLERSPHELDLGRGGVHRRSRLRGRGSERRILAEDLLLQLAQLG